VLRRDLLLDRVRGYYASAEIPNSKAVAGSLRKCGVKNVSVIYNGFDIDALKNAAGVDLHREYQIPSHLPIILALGRLSALKGFDDLLDACNILSLKNIPYFCLILGKSFPDEKKYAASLLAKKESLRLSNVHFAGWRENATAFLKAATLLAVPSRSESFGRTIIEAWACGLPVVATNAGGPAEIIRHGENGYLVARKNPGELAAAMTELLADPVKRESLALSGMKAAAMFTLEGHRDSVVRLYHSLQESRLRHTTV
jgi:glycosyltransferase involved in cell wall biosynthesis